MVIKKIFSIAAVLTIIASFFAGCSKPAKKPAETTANQQTETETQQQSLQNDSPVFMLEKLPEIGPFVDDIKYKRRYPERRETIAPGEDYGKLIPFVEKFKSFHFVDYDTGEWEDEQYTLGQVGLMNTDGEVILDAVYDYSNIYPCANGEYIIYLAEFEEETTVKTLICNSDASWVISAKSMDFGYEDDNKVIQDRIIITEYFDRNSESDEGNSRLLVYDLDGNLLFEKENYSSSYINYYEGYLIANIITDFEYWESYSVFLDEKGNVAFEGVRPLSNFRNGIAIAQDEFGNTGLFTVDGDWAVSPVYNSIWYENGCYVAENGYAHYIYNEDIDIICILPFSRVGENGFVTISNGKPYIEMVDYSQEPYQRTIIDAITGKAVESKELGIQATNLIDGNLLYCVDPTGSYTYIIDYEGNTLAKIEGTGRVHKINEKYFSFRRGSSDDPENEYELYTFDGFKKLWTDKEIKTGDTIQFWEYEEYALKVYTPKDQVDAYWPDHTFDIISFETGEALVEGVKDYRFTQIGNKIYTSYTDGKCTYLIDSDKNILMKTTNEEND